MSDSIWNDPRITAYVLNELSEEDRHAFEAELQGNAELEAAVAEARNVTGQLEGLFAAEETPSLDRDRRSAIVLPAPRGRSWKTPMIALATAASLLMLIGGPMWFSRQDAMIVGQRATDAELERYGKEAVQGTELQRMSASDDEVAQGEFVPTANAERAQQKRLAVPVEDSKNGDGMQAEAPVPSTQYPVQVPPGVTSRERTALAAGAEATAVAPPRPDTSADGADVKIGSSEQIPPAVGRAASRSRVTESVQGARASADMLRPTYAGDKIVPDVETELKKDSDLGGRDNRGLGSARAEALAESEPTADAGSTFTYEGRRTKMSSSLAVGDSNGDGAIDESDVALSQNPVVLPGFAEAAPKRTSVFTPQRAQLGLQDELPALRGATDVELGQAQKQEIGEQEIEDLRRERGIPIRDPEKANESASDPLGGGPGNSGDKFEPISENPFKRVADHSLSTFSVDVDTASYSKTRDFLARAHQLPRPDAVRIEELINYFNYDYEPPTVDDVHPFTTHTVVTSCPWNPEHRLARIALKGKVIEKSERPRCNLVFLLDTSGSMNQPNKLPLVVEGMQMLLKQLNKNDRVAITVYAGSAGLVLDSTPAKKKGKKKIRNALTQLNAGGSTNGGAGIALAYRTARDNFISDGVNRVILCTDGDFNVGTTGTDALVRMVEQEAKGGIFLTVLGFGMGNHNDSMLEQISGRGNGNYAFIDNQQEARKVLVDQTSATLVTIAKDVKLQIEFNPKQVSSYRLIGYENRVLAKEDFNDDKKDAGEIGAGHAVTALYEIVPVGVQADESRPEVDALKYQSAATPTDAADRDELMTLKLRYKAPQGQTSTLVEFPVADKTVAFNEADKDVRFAAAVAGFGMQLRRSAYKGSWTLSDVQAVAEKSKGEDASGLRTEFIELVRKASELMGQE